MATTLLDRIKRRHETDLPDEEITFICDEVNSEILRRFGAHADAGNPISVTLEGLTPWIFVNRPIVSITSVTETVIDTDTVLAADDYENWHGGRALLRLNTGTNGRDNWGRKVVLVYVPEDDNNARQEAIIKIAILDMQYRGLKSERAGDYQAAYAEYMAEREAILTRLGPSGHSLLS